MDLGTLYQQNGAQLAPDGIPLHFGDVAAEYQAGLNHAILLDRSHEGRLEVTGKDRLDLLDRMSTNDIKGLVTGQGKATIFTNANARIIDRVVVLAQDDERLLLLTGPGRGQAVQSYLQRHIFFNDDVTLKSLNETFTHFALHGPRADVVAARYLPDDVSDDLFRCFSVDIGGATAFFARLKPLSHSHWVILVPSEQAGVVWETLLQDGKLDGLRPSGGLSFNALRIRAGMPGVGFELTADYIPLEVGLWDEISFNKGCYTGQEIIARMESRQRMARTIVRLKPDEPVKSGVDLFRDGKTVGRVTSSTTTPDGEHVAIGVLKLAAAEPGVVLGAGSPDGQCVRVGERLGVQPDFLQEGE